MNIARLLRSTCLLTLTSALGMSQAYAQEKITLEYWVYSDFAQGEALKLQQAFIDEFQAKHPNVTINISGKGDDDLTTGQITGAASGNLPDVFMNGLAVGASLVEVKALENLYPYWMKMPQEYRDQFDKEAIANCSPKPETMYCIPYTGYGEMMFRNLTVLEEAGVDTSVPIKDWKDWLSQMEKVKAKGKFGIPDQTQVWQSVVSTYSGITGPDEWGVDFTTMKTKVNPDKYAKSLQMFVDMKPFNSGTSRNDQATKDLFITNQLAFHVVGPWANPTYAQAAKESGLKYDFVLAPGATEGDNGGIKSYEFLGVAPGKNAEMAWEFAAYIAEKQQMLRWGRELARYNANAAAMSDPSIAELPLITMTKNAVEHAIDGMPPYFVGAYPNCYSAVLTDNAAAAADGDVTPEEGAKQLVEELNECLASK